LTTFINLAWEDQPEEMLEDETDEDPANELELHPSQRVSTHHDSSTRFPDVKHQWLCGGRLLLLNEPPIEENNG